MKYEITKEKQETISLEEAIKKEHIIGFVDNIGFENRRLIIKRGEGYSWCCIPSKEKCSNSYFGQYGNLEDIVIEVNKLYEITNSFDNYGDAMKWYLGKLKI